MIPSSGAEPASHHPAAHHRLSVSARALPRDSYQEQHDFEHDQEHDGELEQFAAETDACSTARP